MADIDDFLSKIAQIESANGTNFNHKTIKSGLQKGQTAIGTYGLLPNTVDEIVNRSKDPALKELKDMDPDEQKAYLESNPDKEQLVARHLAEHVLSKQGGDQEKAAFAWNQGHNLSPNSIEARDYEDSDYVKKFNKISDSINPNSSKKYIPSNASIPGLPADKAAPLDMGGTPEGDQIQGYLNNLSAKDIMQQHYAEQNDNLKKAIQLAQNQDNDNPVMHSEMGNQADTSIQNDDQDNSNTLKFGDNQPNNPSLMDNAKQAMGLYDSQVANRPRAAAMAVLKGQNPMNAAINNPPTTGEDIATEGFKTLNPQVTQTTNPSNVLMKQGAALAPAAPIAGMAVNAALDPMTYAGGAVGAVKKLIPETLPAAEQAGASLLGKAGTEAPNYQAKLQKLSAMLDDAVSARKRDDKIPARSFMQKAGPTAPNLSSRAEQLSLMDNNAKTARFKANELYQANPNSTEAKMANAKAFKAESDFDKYKAMYGNGYADGGFVQPGMGDVKQSDRDLDSLIRQLQVSKDAKEQLPNITEAFGGDPEKIYRSKSENYGLNNNPDLESRMSDEYAYGNIFKKAKADLNGDTPNYLPSPYKAPDIEADAFNKDYMANLRKAPESIPQTYTDMKHTAQDIAANAYDKDILKSKDFKDYLEKLENDENVNSPIIIDPDMAQKEQSYGAYSPLNKLIRLSDESKGTAMHEMGHAKLDNSSIKKSDPENDYSYDEKLKRNADILRNYLPQLELRGEDTPDFDDDKARKDTMNRAIDEGRGQLIAEAGSGGHHPGYMNYPIDKTLDEYKNQLDQQGFERQMPESNPKFDRIRGLINTLRNLNNK